MNSFVDRLRIWWSALDKSQRPMILIGGGLLAVLVMGAIYFSSRPQLTMLFGGLNPADQGMVVEELGKIGIQAQGDTNGNVFVPNGKVAEARMKLATAKKLPNSGNLGATTLESIGPMTSPNVEKEKLSAAKEAELANSIETIEGVGAARVHLTVGNDSPFTREAKPASASVVITEVAGGSLMPDQAEAIANLVQFGVEGLKKQNITIINDKGRTLFDGTTQATGAGSADRRVAMEIDESRRREHELQQKLDAAFGTGNTIVSIPILRMNYDRESMTQITRDPSKKPSDVEEVKEEMGDKASEAVGAAGSASNTQPPSETDGSNRSYTGSQRKTSFSTNETERHVEKAPGFLEAMSINVLVNNTKVKDEAPIKAYVKNYLAPFAQDPANFTANVTSVSFDTESSKQMQAAAAASATQNRMQQAISLLPVGALIFIGLMLLKTLSKTAKSLVPVPADPKMEFALPGGEALSLQMPSMHSMPDLTAMSRSELEALSNLPPDQLHGALMNIEPQHEIERIPEKVNVPLEQLRQMAMLKPDSVASLMKSWLLEERR